VDGPTVEQQETEMNTQNQEINLLSDDELDAVAGAGSRIVKLWPLRRSLWAL
jgi:hypothetical protein